MSQQGKDGEQMTKEDKNIIEQISRILVRENYITFEEQFRILELLKEEK